MTTCFSLFTLNSEKLGLNTLTQATKIYEATFLKGYIYVYAATFFLKRSPENHLGAHFSLML